MGWTHTENEWGEVDKEGVENRRGWQKEKRKTEIKMEVVIREISERTGVNIGEMERMADDRDRWRQPVERRNK